MTKIKDVYMSIVIEDSLILESNIKLKKKRSEIADKQNSLAAGNKYATLTRIYHLASIKLFNIILNIFQMNDHYYNDLLTKAKFGLLIGDLLKVQYVLLGQIFDKKKNDINLLNNYIQENRIRLELVKSLLECNREEIKIQFLDSGFIEFMIANMMQDFRRFYTDFKKLSLEFLVFKENFPVRMEAMSFINLIIKKNSDKPLETYNKEEKVQLIRGNNFIYDEMLKNIKKYHLIQQELLVIKNNIKGTKVHSVFLLFSIIILNRSKDLLNIIEQENSADYLNYSIEKDNLVKKMFPEVINYLASQ